MADNVIIPATGSGTATPSIATDDVGGVHYQEVKLDGGGDGLSVPIIAGQQAMAASLPVVVASNQTAIPISAASLPLPLGAATAANQPGLGTAGTANANVLTVQGIAAMTPLLVNGSGSTQPISGSVTVTQATGTNLHTVVDSGTITTVTTVSAVTAISNALPAGNNNIGDVDVATLPALPAGNNNIGDVDVASIAAGTNLIGYIGRKFTVGAASTLTTTNFSSLTNGSGWQSAAISPAGAADIIFSFTTLGAAGSTALVDFYVAETNGTSYTDNATGSEGTFTAANRKNSRYLGSVQLNTTNSVVGELRLSDVMLCPNNSIALIGINNSGGTISATGGNTVFTYQLVY